MLKSIVSDFSPLEYITKIESITFNNLTFVCHAGLQSSCCVLPGLFTHRNWCQDGHRVDRMVCTDTCIYLRDSHWTGKLSVKPGSCTYLRHRHSNWTGKLSGQFR